MKNVRTEDDAVFSFSIYNHFMRVAKIALPTWRCREFIGSTIFIMLFAVKAVLRVCISKMNGKVLATMLNGKPSVRQHRFIQAILLRGAAGLCASVCSGAIEGIRPWLIGCYRERLSRTFQRRFYDKLVYYQATVLDNRLEAADTVIATYCGEFAEHFAELPYYFILPGLESLTSTSALIQQSGVQAAAVMGAIVTASVALLRQLSPQFGHIHAVLLSKEDDYRRMLGNGLTNVENIAMHGAGEYTQNHLDISLRKLKRSLDHMALAKGNFEMLETTFTTFLTIVAYSMTFATSRASFFSRSVDDVYLEIQLIEDLNASVKDFVVNFRELSHLTEFSVKMSEFDQTLSNIAQGVFIHERQGQTDPTVPSSTSEEGDVAPLVYTKINWLTHPKHEAVFPLIKMDNVTLESPIGQQLFVDMNVTINSNENWVIIGENGCGKTSLLRMLTGLWLPVSGTLSLDKGVRYLMAPQHSYMAPQCTLYEQLCFPEKPPAYGGAVRADIEKAIELAGAGTVIHVIGGYDSALMGFHTDKTDESYDWNSLSGGQKQRISMARVFFHVLRMNRNKFTPVVILDEATSMMDETEQDVINNLRRLDVRMISVTHRDVVIRHHNKILKIKKGGEWRVEDVKNPVAIGERVDTTNETV
ncbi:ATP-binding protein cassette, subfamily D (ALD), member 3 [Angomonas deanei]|uniref:ABC transporter transmembrane region 2/ABC transporter, putative n=1 Tax=Angomonas deanei TaxID=59799 RepID=A0A7G2C8M1_9TRYP|nr:ATP-binding protein cassette, subfamily D (ALD), member 3 [Angomonas deanei]CAD2215391.1 ABC transporter transmembrane region 2/ABC transporter, putative [Angomonas deanei]|eukprot:EPY41771.1 ATP-binding protein cassette, subfamily D (ALD), member 3 [Angomonas deanei]